MQISSGAEIVADAGGDDDQRVEARLVRARKWRIDAHGARKGGRVNSSFFTRAPRMVSAAGAYGSPRAA